MNRRVVAVLVVLACAVVGCGGDDDDDDSSPTSSASAGPPTSAAPAAGGRPEIRVTNPRDASALVTDPCRAFTAEQLVPAGYPAVGDLHPARPGSASSRANCRWFKPGIADASVHVLVFEAAPGDPTAFGFLDTGVSKAVQWVEIAGNTATLAQVRAGDLECDALVAVNDTAVLDIGFRKRPDDPGHPCVAAREFAEIAVGNLPPGS